MECHSRGRQNGGIFLLVPIFCSSQFHHWEDFECIREDYLSWGEALGIVTGLAYVWRNTLSLG